LVHEGGALVLLVDLREYTVKRILEPFSLCILFALTKEAILLQDLDPCLLGFLFCCGVSCSNLCLSCFLFSL